MGKHVEIILNMTASNTGESAHNSRMFISYPSSIYYIGAVKSANVRFNSFVRCNCVEYN